MTDTYEYTYDEYPNVKVVVYKGVDGTYETDLDVIITDLKIGKNKYGHTTVCFNTIDKYVEISDLTTYDETGRWITISICNTDSCDRGYYVDINIKHEDGMNMVVSTALKWYYECVIVDYEIFASVGE